MYGKTGQHPQEQQKEQEWHACISYSCVPNNNMHYQFTMRTHQFAMDRFNLRVTDICSASAEPSPSLCGMWQAALVLGDDVYIIPQQTHIHPEQAESFARPGSRREPIHAPLH